MHMTERAHDLSKSQAKATGQAMQVLGTCVTAMLEASAAFAKANAERHVAWATTMMSAHSIDAIAEIHSAFARDAIRAAGALATKMGDACVAAARECNGLAAQAMETVSAPTAAEEK